MCCSTYGNRILPKHRIAITEGYYRPGRKYLLLPAIPTDATAFGILVTHSPASKQIIRNLEEAANIGEISTMRGEVPANAAILQNRIF